jgi:prepilin-type processing-associated H-X9-DG protein
LELLIVIAIISLIVSIMIPAVQSARESARRTECQNNLRQFGIAFQNHEAAKKNFPAGLRVWVKGPLVNLDKSEFAFHGFMPYLLPYLELQQVADRYDHRKMYASPENRPASDSVLPVTLCPSAPHATLHHEEEFRPGALLGSGVFHLEVEHGATVQVLQNIIQHLDDKYSGPSRLAVSDYAGVAIISAQFAQAVGAIDAQHHPFGLNGMFPFPVYDANSLLAFQRSLLGPKESTLEHPMKIAEVVDGLSNTVMLVENAARPEFWERGKLSTNPMVLPAGWANPRTLLLYEGSNDCAVNCSNNEAIYSFHGDVAHVVFVDGHIQAISGSGIDAKVLVAMLTPNWGGTEVLKNRD